MQNRMEAHFRNVPGNYIPHSVFDLSHDSLTSFDVGELIPITEPIEILPTDSFDISVASKIYLNTLIFPIMDDLYVDIFTFYCPFRILWDNYKQFEGENDSTPWTQETRYYVPQVQSPVNGWEVGTIAEKMGIPINVSNLEVSALDFRGYAKIVKDWFYNENIQYPPDFLTDDATIQGSNGDNYITDLIKGGKPFVVGKYKDLFTSCLPAPQKGDSVLLPLGDLDFNFESVDISGQPVTSGLQFRHFVDNGSGILMSAPNQSDSVGLRNGIFNGRSYTGLYQSAQSTPPFLPNQADYVSLQPASSQVATNATINDLRLAFQTQRLFELMARGGTRYYEILASQWGVSAPAGLIQRSELLGQHRFHLNIHTSVQDSSTDSTSPQANLAGYSITTNYHHQCTKAFTERGLLFLLACVRYHHSYSQGIPKHFKKKDKFDFYNNAFAHIGEQPVYNYQIYAQGTDVDDEVFGYNEYGIDYKFRPNIVTGQMRPTYSNPLSYMHLGDKYDTLPTLSADFIREDKNVVNRVIAVGTDTTANQLRANFHFEIKAMRPMPLYNVPGLIDHL